ncbi:MAG TPA: cytochrome P450 [Polyangia bacterium]|jgi:cytochrome P450|nr:cytochrome P450 [Polyangia bacterium]
MQAITREVILQAVFGVRGAAHENSSRLGGGPRRCLGADFATVELKVVLAEVLARVDVLPALAPARIVRRGIMFAPSGDLRLRVRRDS